MRKSKITQAQYNQALDALQTLYSFGVLSSASYGVIKRQLIRRRDRK